MESNDIVKAYLTIKSLNDKHNIGLSDEEILALLEIKDKKEPKET